MNRIVVAVVATGVFAFLCWDAVVRLSDTYPPIGECFESPQRHAGKRVWLSPNPVLKSEDYYFELDAYDMPVRVYSTMRPLVGSYVMVYGTFQSDLSVMAIKCREEPGYRVKRAGVYLVSFIVIVAGAFFFFRTFAWRDGAFHPR